MGLERTYHGAGGKKRRFLAPAVSAKPVGQRPAGDVAGDGVLAGVLVLFPSSGVGETVSEKSHHSSREISNRLPRSAR